jgi:two-component system phosphate regulon sensor histidine kinase PhoR
MKAYFPKRIFWRSFWSHVSAYVFVVLFGLGVGYWFLVPELGPVSKDEFHHLVGPWLLKVLPLLLIYMVVVSLWFSYHSVRPLAQIIKTVRSMVNRRGLMAAELDDDEVFEEEEGEFYELDIALSRVRRKLKKKYDQLDQLREESETLMMSMADAVVSVDGHQRLVFFNSQFAKHFLTHSQTQRTTYFSDVLRDPELLGLVNNTISRGEVGERTLSLTSLLERRDRDYGVSISPLRRPDEGPIYGALLVFHDITHLKAAERMRIEFLSNVSHELRTPLTTIKGYVDLVKEDLEGGNVEGAKQFVPILSRNINRLVDLVNDLLLISKMESAPELQIEVNDTHRISDNIKEEFSRALSEKGQEIVVTATAPVLKADAVKLQQILRNLVSNAVRYGPEGGKIELKWLPVASGIEVRVKDQGQGISEQHLARLFERFYRVDKGRSRELGGTGLGLAIVKHLMLAHKGTVNVKSKLGEGAEFICFFPQS